MPRSLPLNLRLHELQELVVKGRGLYAHMLAEIARFDSWDRMPPDLSAKNYIINLDYDGMPAVEAGVYGMIRNASQPLTGYYLACVRNIVSEQNDPPYQNYIHKDGKSILCINNCAARDVNQQPSRIFWSDIMAACCIKAMEITGGEMRFIETIWRVEIKNILTHNLIKDASNRQQGSHCDYIDIDSSNDDFYALLGADHGKEPARMLATYPRLFGGKIIARARIFHHSDNPHLCWFLEEIEKGNLSPTTPTPNESMNRLMSKKQRRKQKRNFSALN